MTDASAASVPTPGPTDPPSIEVVVGASADFDRFFDAEYPGLVALAAAVTGDRPAAEDIAAEAMTRAYRDWARVGSYDRPGAWVRRVTVNLLHSRRRRATSELKALLRLGHRRPSHDRGDDVVGSDHFDRLLAGLPPRQRTAVALHYLADLPVADIADAMGCAVGTVKAHLHAGRTAVAARLAEEDE